MTQDIHEAGRRLSTETESKLRLAWQVLGKILNRKTAQGVRAAKVPRKTAQGVSASAREALTLPDDMSTSQLSQALVNALQAQGIDGYIVDVFGDSFVYAANADWQTKFRASYVLAKDRTATFGTPIKVMAETTYIPIEEAGPLGLTQDEVRDALRDAIVAKVQSANPDTESFPYIHEIYPQDVFFELGDKECGAAYRLNEDGTYTIGDIRAAEYLHSYYYADPDVCPYCGIDIGNEDDFDIDSLFDGFESTSFAENGTDQANLGQFVHLEERALDARGNGRIKIIQPGWGSSGYYSAPVLERDGPKVFRAGTHMYWNHPTNTEAVERPERDLDKLAARLTSDARWESNGVAGPGLYADVQVRSAYQNDVNELADWIGTSIIGEGESIVGEAEGRKGKILTRLTAGRSVDFVTVPGAGGQIIQMFEAAGRQAPAAPTDILPTIEKVTTTVSETDIQTLNESVRAATAKADTLAVELEAERQASARLREAFVLAQSKALVDRTLASIDMHDLTRARIAESQYHRAVIADGVIDEAAYVAQITEAANTELEYLAKALPVQSNPVRGFGATIPRVTQTPADADAILAEAFRNFGLPESAATIAASK